MLPCEKEVVIWQFATMNSYQVEHATG